MFDIFTLSSVHCFNSVIELCVPNHTQKFVNNCQKFAKISECKLESEIPNFKGYCSYEYVIIKLALGTVTCRNEIAKVHHEFQATKMYY